MLADEPQLRRVTLFIRPFFCGTRYPTERYAACPLCRTVIFLVIPCKKPMRWAETPYGLGCNFVDAW
jgi:hypothetical protein